MSPPTAIHDPDQDDLETSVALMARVGASLGPSFSPDGSRIAFLTDLTGVFQVWTVPASGGWPELVTPFDDWITSVAWSPDGSWLAFNLAPGGGMNRQVYVIRPDGSGARLLTDGGQENNWLGRWTPDGKRLAIASNRDDPNAMDVYLIDVESGEMRLAVKNHGTGHLEDIGRDGNRAILQRTVHRSDSNLYLVDLETGTETLLTPHEGPGNFFIGRLSPDATIVYLTSDKDRDRVAFACVELDGEGRAGEIETLVARDDADLQDFELTEDGAEAALIWNVAGRNELTFFHCCTRQSRPHRPGLPRRAGGTGSTRLQLHLPGASRAGDSRHGSQRARLGRLRHDVRQPRQRAAPLPRYPRHQSLHGVCRRSVRRCSQVDSAWPRNQAERVIGEASEASRWP